MVSDELNNQKIWRKNNGEEKKGFRRSFLKGMAVGAAGIAATGSLVGCGNEQPTEDAPSNGADEEAKASLRCRRSRFQRKTSRRQ